MPALPVRPKPRSLAVITRVGVPVGDWLARLLALALAAGTYCKVPKRVFRSATVP